LFVVRLAGPVRPSTPTDLARLTDWLSPFSRDAPNACQVDVRPMLVGMELLAVVGAGIVVFRRRGALGIGWMARAGAEAPILRPSSAPEGSALSPHPLSSLIASGTFHPDASGPPTSS
jgi:hypothetical protein